MKINAIGSINSLPKYSKNKNVNYRLYQNLKRDAVSFKSKDFLELSNEETYRKIQESIVPENFIGKGTEAVVYRIKGTNYCVRIPYETLGAFSKNLSTNIQYCNKNILPEEKVNHVKIILNYGAKVLDFIEGTCPKSYVGDNNKRYELQREIAQMPMKSYTELLHQIANGIDNEMAYDFSGGNLIVNTKEKKLTAIDFLSLSENYREVKPLSEIYSVITAYGAEQSVGKKIFENVFHSGLEEFKSKKTPCMDVELFDFDSLCNQRIKETKMEHTEKLMQKISQQIRIMKGLKKNEHLEDLFSTFIEEKIYSLKNLIKHVK